MRHQDVTAPSYRPPVLPETRPCPHGFDELYARMLAEFGGRDTFVFPDEAVLRHQSEAVVATVRNLLVPFGEKKAPTTDYYRALLKPDGRIAVESMPSKSPVFEIDAEGRLVGGSGVPMRVYERFVPRKKPSK